MARDSGSAAAKTSYLKSVLAHLSGDEARFAEDVFASGALDNAEAIDPADIAADVRDCMSFIADKPPQRHKMRIRPSAKGKVTLVEILNDDMPFLVDSVIGEIQARGHDVKFVVHPLFKTQRSESGRLEAILGAGDREWADGRQESLIAIYLDAMPAAAACDLGRALSDILSEVRLAVSDWRAMVKRVERAASDVERAPLAPEQRAAAADLLRWLVKGSFTFLGFSEQRFAADGTLHPIEDTALGLLRLPTMAVLRRGGEEIAITREFKAADGGPLVISKASALSRIHRRVYMDYIAVATYGPTKEPTGELRIVGLFTSQAYTQTARDIPTLKAKIDHVIAKIGYPEQSHAGKALANILDTFPRDELFQIDVQDLEAWARGILDLDMRPRVRLFARPDRFGRFVSLLLYTPRERWTTAVREKVGGLIADACRGHVVAFHPHYSDGPLLRIQFIISTPAGPAPPLDTAALEREIAVQVRTWEDNFGDEIAIFGDDAGSLGQRYAKAFPAAYTDTFPPARAIEDIRRIERLLNGRDPIAVDFFKDNDSSAARVNAAVSRVGDPIRLSERVPILENLGFSVIDERSYRIAPVTETGKSIALHHMQLETADGAALDLAANDARIEDAFRTISNGGAENDLFNRLVIAAPADWREAMLMRAYGAYIRQLNAPFGARYLAETLLRHGAIARDLIDLFHVRFDPDPARHDGDAEALNGKIISALGKVASADEDRILRIYLNLILASVRTNFYQRDGQGQPPATLAIKFDSHLIDAVPQPKPYREIWVYSPRVEGVHLRFAPIARGGIRWSDRAQDFRTEVLGLVKAQRVKNAVIVPSGAKGGFLPKRLPHLGNRDEIAREGREAYSDFINALLTVTDNIVDGVVVPPSRVIRHDGDDPYLVVAADKGTATFSDLANAISNERRHWLGDAFASGGSVGYDHKKMAITARGAWECVQRHFREMDIDIQATPFRVAGIGDMSGDVFGNGMLLSPAIRLVAAFDHRDIFIDPNPDAALALGERQRLFELPRSSWQDYDKAKISEGGGVFPRAAKSIALTSEIKALLRLDGESATPAEVMRAILKLDTDLLWFGGIGT